MIKITLLYIETTLIRALSALLDAKVEKNTKILDMLSGWFLWIKCSPNIHELLFYISYQCRHKNVNFLFLLLNPPFYIFLINQNLLNDTSLYIILPYYIIFTIV